MTLFWRYCLPVLFADFITKGIFFHYLPHAKITSFLNIVSVWNHGITFGMLQHNDLRNQLLLTWLVMTIILYLVYWIKSEEHHQTKIILNIILGGALGNFLDRLRFGAVYDFIDFHIYGYHWPAFNIADSCITIGALYLIYTSLRHDVQLSKVKKISKK